MSWPSPPARWCWPWPAAGGWSVSACARSKHVERTADSIAAGNLDQRVPGADDTTEVGRLARALNVMLERIESAFSARVASEARLKESDRHLRQFVADASHELRTPIAAVSAYAELFERGAATKHDDLPRVISGIRNETARMDRLVNDLLTLARLDEGLPLQIVDTELVGLVAEAVHTATTVGPQWPVQFTASHPVEVKATRSACARSSTTCWPTCGPTRPRAPPPRCTSTRPAPWPRSWCATPGRACRSEEAARVFERFYRADALTGPHHGGAGLGLSIVAAIVAAHGGTVSATSSPGQGMTVTVRLPVIPEVIELPEPVEAG